MNYFFNKNSTNPIIASIKDPKNIDIALNSSCKNIFLSSGNIFNLKEISNKVNSKQKGLFIYVDNIDGFSKDTWGLEYIVKNINLNGIISSKPNLINLSKSMGVFTIYNMHILDTYSLNRCLQSIIEERPHALEILPGIMPSVIKSIVDKTKIPLISSGLIKTRKDILNCLDAGAIAVSSSNPAIWNTKV